VSFKVAIAAEVALVTPTEQLREESALAFGRDLDCATDLTEDCAEIDGGSQRAVAQAIVRRFITPRGGLIDDYGHDVRQYCNRALTDRDIMAIEAQLSGEASKDDRVESVSVAVQYTASTSTLRLTCIVHPRDPSLDVFTLTFELDADGELIQEAIT